MKKFMYLYVGWGEPTPEVKQAWGDWFAAVGPRFVDSGNPFSGGRQVTKTGSSDLTVESGEITGYSIINAESIDEAQKLLDEAKERAKKYQGALKEVEADAATAKAGLISSGKGEVERLLAEAQEKAERMKRDAERLVEQERKAVHQSLIEETIELATREATQLLQKAVTADDHARLAQDLLLELARRPAARATTTRASVGPPPAPSGPPATGAQS